MDAATAEVGSTANHYQVLAKLATGGMAEIFLARSAGAVQRYVVLKRVLRERATDITFMRMFLEEARLAAQLQHPNIAQVFDVGKLGDSYFFTMEYVHGETVRAVMSRAHHLRRSPPIGGVLAIAAGAAAGLHHAHERIGIEGVPLGIVHRDVSPTNLMVGYDGSVKVVDFGVAKATDRIHETQSGAVKGKISYLSPEQARGQKLDRRSDLFSLGIVLWELLTVERLYKHDSDFETMATIIGEPAPPPSSRRRDIPPELDALVLRALAKAPEDRFQTAEELAEAIERVAVQTSSPLSAAGVSRFLRELFGTRPEPWLALQSAPAAEPGEVVTVTSEPIPAEIKIPISDPVDRRLAAVVDLSAAEADQALDLARPSTIPRPEPVTASVSIARPPTGSPRPRETREPEPVTASIVIAPPSPAPARPSPAPVHLPTVRPPTAPPPIPATPASAQPPPDLSSPSDSMLPTSSRPSFAALAAEQADLARPSFPALPADQADLARPSFPGLPAPDDSAPSSRLILVLGALSAGAAIAIAVVVAIGADDPAPPPSQPVAAASAPAVDAAAPTIAAPTIDAPAPEPTVSPIEIEPPPDAAVTEPAPPPRRAKPRAKDRPKDKPDVARLVDAGRYRDAVAECTANGAADRASCTLAACHVRDVAHARTWFARLAGAQRTRVMKSCKAMSVVVDKDCQADPMACPR